MLNQANIKPSELSKLIKEAALKLGFEACGIAEAAELVEDAALAESWLAKGFQGEMTYMERNKDKRYDPRLLVEQTQSIVSVLYNYFPGEQLPASNNFKISKYAYGKDYHKLIRDKLNELLAFVETHTGKLEQARAFTDSAPILDRAWAQKSNLGFIGKNTCLIHPEKGSFFFIGHLFLPVKLVAEKEEISAYCGSCRRCIDACPTGALVAPHELDARKCIAYLTVEHRSDLPQKLRPAFDDWIFGCDICQDVCPWNRFSKPHKEPLFMLSNELKKMRKSDWEELDKSKFNELFKGSAVKRTKFDGLKRNIEFLKNK
ncbi:MAG: tRNA epoxyqueuosine(34) reductase QueG [Bacteroidetes bacterium]|nr:tRNA epoxyqueuosine(34) reductase QueG [Bacteroidota bacterium]MBU1577792.1 tRNA epoxyqueuosine(34) reductase QueG [Bacteroidota bacterium]MBU2465630.1 tRNA epoxyqueuosine(34) reductase QueG [Bacteroidota bacterium]MBU2558752.1 tRNA epoxyqueuosine(34) reductase QueG [Bacteroidota bacterium]